MQARKGCIREVDLYIMQKNRLLSMLTILNPRNRMFSVGVPEGVAFLARDGLEIIWGGQKMLFTQLCIIYNALDDIEREEDVPQEAIRVEVLNGELANVLIDLMEKDVIGEIE